MADTKITALTEATSLVDADEIAVVTDVATVPVTKRSLLSTLVTYIVSAFHAATGKTTPVDADEVLLMDSAASYVKKILTIANLRSDVVTDMGPNINGLTSKATPVDADKLPLADSAATNAAKHLTWANLKATLKTYFDGLYASLTGATFTGSIIATDSNIRSNSQTINDDTVYSFTPSINAGMIIIFQSTGANDYGFIYYAATNPTAYATGYVLGSGVVVGTGALTDGTGDGTDLKLNVFAHTDGKIYIKNRLGSNRVFRWILI